MAEPNWQNRTVYHGDNLEMLRAMDTGTVHLLPTDPPFNTGEKRDSEGGGFDDEWAGKFAEHGRWLDAIRDHHPAIAQYIWGVMGSHSQAMAAYLSFMAARLVEASRVLRSDGSIFVHGDDRVTPYQKVLMDLIFGRQCFRNAVQWERHKGRSDARRFARLHETILFYSRPGAPWNPEWLPHTNDHLESSFRYDDNDGRGPWESSSLMGPKRSGGPSGQPWRGIDVSRIGKRGRCWSTPMQGGMFRYIVENDLVPGYPDAYPTPQARLDALDAAGLIHWPKRGSIPRLKRYLASTEGRAISDFISHIKPVQARSKENTKHADQKPVALYAMFIRVASNPGDVVLDPFGGCFTTAEAAELEGRRWIIADTEEHTVKHAKERMLALTGDDKPRLLDERKPIIIRGLSDPKMFRRSPGDAGTQEVFSLERQQSDELKGGEKDELKRQLYARQGGCCRGFVLADGSFHECSIGGGWRAPSEMELDHIRPKKHGGKDVRSNLQVICGPDNRWKGTCLTKEELMKRKRPGV